MSPEQFDEAVRALLRGERGPFIEGELDDLAPVWLAERIAEARAPKRERKPQLSQPTKPEYNSASSPYNGLETTKNV